MRIRFYPLLAALLLVGCSSPPDDQPQSPTAAAITPLDAYVAAPDTAYGFEDVHTIPGDGATTHVLRMTSQRWLSAQEVEDPLWWHWLTLVVPDSVAHGTGLLVIGGGSRNDDAPDAADPFLLQTALATHSVTASLHNVPNQPMTFVGDDYGPRVEDELIAYGWRQYLDGGGRDEDARWLARLPMTKAAVRALDTITAYCTTACGRPVEQFVVAGGSKRGWTTWTTAAVDDRVVAIAPIVIDMLNVVPSFEHHWQAYGFWAPAVGDYDREGIMDRQRTDAYRNLMAITEPYSYRDRLTLPKFIINATGDEFFLPDSWRFYWDGLEGEKHLRYVPNANHSLAETDALESFVAFYEAILTDTPRPSFSWHMEGTTLIVETDPAQPPQRVTLWQAVNAEARDFRVDTIGKTWQSRDLPSSPNGTYRLSLQPAAEGYRAFFAELAYPGPGDLPFTMSTGVVVAPDTYVAPPYNPRP